METLINIIWGKYANPWNIWLRFLILPMLIISMWSRVWIQEWSLLLTLTLFILILLQARLSSKKPKSIWVQKAVMGERIWSKRHKNLIPEHHFIAITVIQTILIISFIICTTGIVLLNYELTLFGLLITYIAMCWFLDRMVWLYNDYRRLRNKEKMNSLERKRKRKKQQMQKQKISKVSL